MTLVTDMAGAAAIVERQSFWKNRTVRRLLRHRSFMIGMVLCLLVTVLAVLAPVISPFDPARMSIRNRFQLPSATYWLGTDNLGRDIFSRIAWGARFSLAIGLGVVVLNAVFGVLLGALAGYYRRLDGILMRLADALMAFPSVLLAIGIAAAMGPSAMTAVISLAVVYIPRTARILRSSVLVVKEMEYVQAAIGAGARDVQILFRHILPNCMAPLIVQLSFVFAYAVLSEAVLSFLGLGSAPSVPSWGMMIAEGRGYIREAAWLTIFPGIAIAVTVLGLNLLGDGLRDVLDPRVKLHD
ncbi:MAG: ABC transporter permease [Chelatococcus sp.]|jgi:peptide/nickel transport system permease protein|uniref:ABC transporter permease n=1 Tax=unclassified Chelatococcus TaxID=2638111 RepID=UPI001BCFEE3F|nr:MULTISPECIES: ABC transporter permease [unclassified Chelatococcus]CAH1648499.1 Peptide/nickel transport system permease protein [Hyphomicrobiales bacterium]MBS7741927.1 ABC transporter permease [Chelatococcus sp. HY11]MBX3538805.1 ABC transporter permease [Chelatococcus sp.]MBX3541275.1 ABC transporter permease [Chelatococcus sp.]MCO5074832.1 ABC transporter permease [Chelatococcus sp.]